jgi:hypothetical protein
LDLSALRSASMWLTSQLYILSFQQLFSPNKVFLTLLSVHSLAKGFFFYAATQLRRETKEEKEAGSPFDFIFSSSS